MENKFFLHQIKRTNGAIDKGIVVKDTFEGAYAYGQNIGTDFVKGGYKQWKTNSFFTRSSAQTARLTKASLSKTRSKARSNLIMLI